MKYLALGVLTAGVLGSTVAIGQVVYNNASTAGESYARGMSDVIQAQGQANLSNSQAAINLTDARSQQIDNQVKSVNAFWANKDQYDARHEAEIAKITDQRNTYLSRHGLTSLTPEEFDRTTGQVIWLKILQQPQYDGYRNTLDEIMKKRAYQGMLTGEDYMSASAASKAWRKMMAGQKNEYPQPILSQMIRFVLKIDRELNDNMS